jgi:hypothetical protein
MGLTIWLPEAAKEAEIRKVRVCTVLTDPSTGETCGKRFPWEQRQQWMRHVKACDRRHSGAAEEHARRLASNAFSGYADKEAREWITKRVVEGKPATKRGRPA